MRMKSGTTSNLIAGLSAGLIYFIIAFATGASAVSSIIGGIGVALVAMLIGFAFRVFFKRRALTIGTRDNGAEKLRAGGVLQRLKPAGECVHETVTRGLVRQGAGDGVIPRVVGDGEQRRVRVGSLGGFIIVCGHGLAWIPSRIG